MGVELPGGVDGGPMTEGWEKPVKLQNVLLYLLLACVVGQEVGGGATLLAPAALSSSDRLSD